MKTISAHRKDGITIDYRIIDVHAHVWPSDLVPRISAFLSEYYQVPWCEGGTFEHIIESMENSGIYKAVVFSVATKSTQVANINNFISELPRDRVIPFGTMHQDFEDYKNELRRIKELGLKGVKLHPDFQDFNIDDIKMMRIYDEIGDSLPIIMHLGDRTSQKSSPERMAKVLDQMPYLRVIGAHFGGFQMWDEAMKHLIGRNIYIETSSSLPWLGAEKAAEMINGHGEDKFLFGTDYPMTSYKKELELFMQIPLTEEQRRKILGENIERLLGEDL